MPFFSGSRATFVLKFGALTHTSTVCPARNFRCLAVNDFRTLRAPFFAFSSFRFLDLNGHFLPLQKIFTFIPGGDCCVINNDFSVRITECFLKSHPCDTPTGSVWNGSAVPSQFSSIRLPLISFAPGRIAALASLQSCPAKNPSLSLSMPGATSAGAPTTLTVIEPIASKVAKLV